MCGICGIYNYGTRKEIQHTTIKKMTDVINHRGPDEDGYFIDKRIGLGFRRLSIVDITGGYQPMKKHDNSMVSVCNGEIFNHEDIRSSLRDKGYSFKSGSDCEVLINLYEEYGEKMVDYLDGQFAFCVYDRNNDFFMLARDHFGVAPLYYTMLDGQIIFASEIKSIIEYDSVTRRVDLTGLDQVLSLPGLVSPRTMFENIHSLPPGHVLIIKNGRVQCSQYWDAVYPHEDYEGTQYQEEYYLEKLDHLLKKSVKKRLMSDVKLGSYLSGGLDSSLIGGIIRSLKGESGITLSMEFEDDFFNEQKHQDTMVKFLQSEHFKMKFKEMDIIDGLKKVITHCECPLKESYNVASLALSGEARRNNIKVILTGEGADELFAGYPSYKFDLLREKRINSKRSEITDRESRINLWGDENFFYEKDFNTLESMKRKIFSKGVREKYKEFDLRNFGLIDKGKITNRHIQHKRSYLDLKLRIADHLIGDHGDRMLFGNSVEGRYPFLDKELFEFIATIPTNLKLNGMDEKYLLKKLALKYIPESIVTREKFGFSAPGSPQILQQNVEWVNELLSYETIKKQGYFDPDYVESLKKMYTTPGFMLNIPYEDDLLIPILTFGIFKEIFKIPDL